MLDSIFDAIGKIVEFLDTLWNFVLDFLDNTFNLIKLVGETISILPDYFTWLPAPVIALVISIFSIVIIYKILGRD